MHSQERSNCTVKKYPAAGASLPNNNIAVYLTTPKNISANIIEKIMIIRLAFYAITLLNAYKNTIFSAKDN